MTSIGEVRKAFSEEFFSLLQRPTKSISESSIPAFNFVPPSNDARSQAETLRKTMKEYFRTKLTPRSSAETFEHYCLDFVRLLSNSAVTEQDAVAIFLSHFDDELRGVLREYANSSNLNELVSFVQTHFAQLDSSLSAIQDRIARYQVNWDSTGPVLTKDVMGLRTLLTKALGRNAEKSYLDSRLLEEIRRTTPPSIRHELEKSLKDLRRLDPKASPGLDKLLHLLTELHEMYTASRAGPPTNRPTTNPPPAPATPAAPARINQVQVLPSVEPTPEIIPIGTGETAIAADLKEIKAQGRRIEENASQADLRSLVMSVQKEMAELKGSVSSTQQRPIVVNSVQEAQPAHIMPKSNNNGNGKKNGNKNGKKNSSKGEKEVNVISTSGSSSKNEKPGRWIPYDDQNQVNEDMKTGYDPLEPLKEAEKKRQITTNEEFERFTVTGDPKKYWRPKSLIPLPFFRDKKIHGTKDGKPSISPGFAAFMKERCLLCGMQSSSSVTGSKFGHKSGGAQCPFNISHLRYSPCDRCGVAMHDTAACNLHPSYSKRQIFLNSQKKKNE